MGTDWVCLSQTWQVAGTFLVLTVIDSLHRAASNGRLRSIGDVCAPGNGGIGVFVQNGGHLPSMHGCVPPMLPLMPMQSS